MLHYDGVLEKIETLVIPGCELLCPYDKFLQLTSTTIATNTDLTDPLDPVRKEEMSYLPAWEI